MTTTQKTKFCPKQPSLFPHAKLSLATLHICCVERQTATNNGNGDNNGNRNGDRELQIERIQEIEPETNPRS